MAKTTQSAGLTGVSKVIIVLVVIACTFFGYQSMAKKDGGSTNTTSDKGQFKTVDTSKMQAESQDLKGITTVS